jgi:hypothetical protein
VLLAANFRNCFCRKSFRILRVQARIVLRTAQHLKEACSTFLPLLIHPYRNYDGNGFPMSLAQLAFTVDQYVLHDFAEVAADFIGASDFL